MTGKERIHSAFEHRQADRVPRFEQSIASDVASALLGRQAYAGTTYMHYQEACAWCRGEAAHDEFVEQLYDDMIDLARLLGLDMLHPPWRLTERPTERLDECKFLYGDRDSDHVIRTFDPAAKTYGVSRSVSSRTTDPYDMDILRAEVEDMENRAAELQIDDPTELWPAQARMLAEHGNEFAVTGGAGLAIPLNESWLGACVLAPELVGRYLDAQLQTMLVYVEAQARMGLRVIWGGYDLADNSGPVYGPAVFREMVLPRLKVLTARCHELGQWFLFRTDGNLWAIEREFFVDSGIDGYGEIDHAAGMTIEKLKPRYGDRICFWGNVPCGTILARGTPQEVRDFTLRLVEVASPGGGFILGSSNSILPNTPPENVLAMFSAAEG